MKRQKILNFHVFLREIGNTNKAMLPWLFAQKGKYNKMCCPLEPIRPSPTQVCTVYVYRIPPFVISILCSYAVLCLCACELAPPTALVTTSPTLGATCRRSTGTSASSSSQWEPTARIRPSASAWASTKAARAPWSARRRRATCRPRPNGWSQSSRSSSGTHESVKNVPELLYWYISTNENIMKEFNIFC